MSGYFKKGVSSTVIQDAVSGKWYIGVVDAAPAGYDETRERLKVDTERKIEVLTLTYDEVLNLATASQKLITIQPPAGYVWRVKNVYLTIPAMTGASAGTHRIVFYQGNVFYNYYLTVNAAYTSAITMQHNTVTASTSQVPGAQADLQRNLLAITASYDTPLIIQYLNNQGITTTNTIIIRLIVESEKVI